MEAYYSYDVSSMTAVLHTPRVFIAKLNSEREFYVEFNPSILKQRARELEQDESLEMMLDEGIVREVTIDDNTIKEIISLCMKEDCISARNMIGYIFGEIQEDIAYEAKETYEDWEEEEG